MQLNENPKNREKSEGNIKKYRENISRSVVYIVQELREIGRESMLVDFILHPGKYLDMLPDIYRENPELKRITRKRHIKK